MNYKLEKFIDLLDVANSVYGQVFTNHPICNVLKSVFPFVNSLSLLFSSSQDDLEHWR